MDLLCSMAHFSMAFRPKIAVISINASISSLELKTGNLWVKSESNMIPADQTSTATISPNDLYVGVLTSGLIRALQ